MDYPEYLDWLQYMEFAPSFEERANVLFASIVSALINLNRDVKAYPKPFPLKEFVLLFGEDTIRKREPAQTLETVQKHFDAWIQGVNASFAERGIILTDVD